MQKRSLFSKTGLSMIVLAAGLFLSSCSSKITDEQLAQLDGLRRDEAKLNEQISKVKNEKSRLEAELNARKSELKQCEDQVNYIKAKLATWPDVWPDWKPEQK
jgi:septal ring factor EnvC (AmiA/AmiB activator)